MSPSSEDIPERIGRYRILGQLGKGGMGVVFEAEQDAPRRRVALKVVTAGIQSDELRRRFELEAQVLGHLQHPCIAQIYEAGMHTSAGGSQPYFAMELIRGVPLDRYAREHGLGTRERLELIARICDGVQHAHQRGVIHRDLKPANLLVDEEGSPKILDFGLARATDADLQTATLHTDVGQIMGTIPYMSPEQAAGDPAALDTRTDIYSLGVVAYELVSGAMPYAADDPRVLEALRIVREEDARPLSSINRSLGGDVETIVGKALEKEPERRYASASAFAADIRRYLHDEPITARRPSAAYQLRKFARRNKALVLGVAAVFVALVLGLAGTARGYFAARVEAERARHTADFFQNILAGVDPAVAQGSDTTLLKAILDDTAARIGVEFAGRPEVEGSIRGVMTSAYFSIAEFEAALDQARAAYTLQVRERGERSLEAIVAHRRIGTILLCLDRFSEAQAQLSANLAMTEAVLGLDHPLADAARCELGVLLLDVRRGDEAAELLERVLAFRRRTLDPDSTETLTAVNALGLARIQQGRLEDAEELLHEALEGRRRVFGETHPETIKAVHNLGGLYSKQQRFAEAETLYRDALQRNRRILGERHDTTLGAQQNLANLLNLWERHGEALDLQRAVWETLRADRGAEDLRTIDAEILLARIYNQMERSEAEVHAVHGYQVLAAQVGAEHSRTLSALSALASARAKSGDRTSAEQMRRQLIEIFTRVHGEDHPDTLIVTNDLGVQLLDEGRTDDAQPLVERALAAKRRVLGDDHIETLRSLMTLALLHHRENRPALAVPLQAEFLAAWSRLIGDGDSLSKEAAQDLAEDLARVEPLGPHEPALRMLLAFHERTAGPAVIAHDLVLHGEALLDLGRADEAVSTLERALELFAEPALPPPRALATYGAALTALGRFDEAQTMLLMSWEDATDLPASERRRIARHLAALQEAAGRPEDAESWRRELAGLEE